MKCFQCRDVDLVSRSLQDGPRRIGLETSRGPYRGGRQKQWIKVAQPFLRWIASYNGATVTTVIENLLARKQKLIEQLETTSATEERDDLERQLEQINTALDFVDRPGATEK